MRKTSVVLICEVPQSISDLDDHSLKILISDIIRSPQEPSLYTLIKFIAGDVNHDVAQRYGEPLDFKVSLNYVDQRLRHLSFHWEYPSAAVEEQITNYALERWNYWTSRYVSALPAKLIS